MLCISLLSGGKRPPSVDVSRCKRPLVLNVANPSRETTPLLRLPHSDMGGGVLNEGFHCSALKIVH